jgi:CHAD domain-containing protein
VGAESTAIDELERELKFDVPDGWQLPSPDVLVPGGRVARSTVHLETTYYDTPTRRLLGSRITLRCRTGDTDTGWQLKVPAGDARTEIRLPLNGRGVPAELNEATFGVRGRAELHPVATLRTAREVHNLLDADGTALAEIVVDNVSTGNRSWREVEVELHDGAEEDLDRVRRWLVVHGAADAGSASKLARALDVRTPRRDLGTLSGLVGRYLDEQYATIVGRDIDLRRGRDSVHDARVAIRRYRSVLRELRDVLDPVRTARLDTEMRWFAALLGDVRDREVLRAHLDRVLAALPTDLAADRALARIDRVLTREHLAAQARVARAMRGRRYLALLAELRRWHTRIPVVDDGPADGVARSLRRSQRRVARRVDAVPDGAGRDDALHRVRKAAKRTRYLAELAEPALGRKARKVARRHEELQKSLGDRQDAVLAAAFLQRLGMAAHADVFTLGVLYQRELAAKAQVRASV